jgi:hypothetical protein
MMEGRVVFNNGKWEGYGKDGNRIVRSQDPRRIEMMMALNGYNVRVEGIVPDTAPVAPAAEASTFIDEGDARWDINQRFEFLEQLVTMVARGRAVSLIVCGPQGLGKTHTVRETLAGCGLEDASGFESEVGEESYKFIKGYSTPKGLYRELFLNRDSVIVFDDCDDVMKDATALNLLKGALDSHDRRIINWNADLRDDDLPRSFVFNGRVIFITNMKRARMNGALKSRAYIVDLDMTDAQKVERMGAIAGDDSFMPTYEPEHKMDALALITELGDRVKELNLRTLQAVVRIRANGGNWRALAEYTITN